jgi:hypothetical protein
MEIQALVLKINFQLNGLLLPYAGHYGYCCWHKCKLFYSPPLLTKGKRMLLGELCKSVIVEAQDFYSGA